MLVAMNWQVLIQYSFATCVLTSTKLAVALFPSPTRNAVPAVEDCKTPVIIGFTEIPDGTEIEVAASVTKAVLL
jgi:hypothetical protein